MDAVEPVAGDADARLEGELGGAVDGHRRRGFQPGDVIDGERQYGVLPAHALHLGLDLAHVGHVEFAFEIERGGIDGNVVDGAVQNLGGRLAVDVERLRQEHRALLHQLLDALVALGRHAQHGVGDDHHRAGDGLRPAPFARHVSLDAFGAIFALLDQGPDEKQRDREQEHEPANEEELEAGAAEDASNRNSNAFHDNVSSCSI